MGGRTFLNNVSLGVYATLVHEPGYRQRKAGVTGAVVPASLRREGEPVGLAFRSPAGRVYRDALVLLVANNPYTVYPVGRRERLDAGVLQVSALLSGDGARIARAIAELAADRPGPADDWVRWTATTLRVEAAVDRLPAGLDGEAVELATPLEFRARPGALRVLVPPGAGPARPRARLFSPAAVRALLRLAGRPGRAA